MNPGHRGGFRGKKLPQNLPQTLKKAAFWGRISWGRLNSTKTSPTLKGNNLTRSESYSF
jgi:hypothetical protein